MSIGKWLTNKITHHFGGIPKRWSDLQWIYMVNPTLPDTVVPASDYRTISPQNQPPPLHASQAVEKPVPHAYYVRDLRRSYPQTVVYSATELASIRASASSSASLGAGSAVTLLIGIAYLAFEPLSSSHRPSSTATTTSLSTGNDPSTALNTSLDALNEAALPFVPNHRYHWTRSAPHLKPHDQNPDFHIRGYK